MEYFWVITVFAIASLFGAAVLLTFTWLAHVHYPFNRVHGVLGRDNTAAKTFLYLLAVYPITSFFYWHRIFPEPDGPSFMLFCYAHLFLSMIGVECAYQFRKLNKWNTIWLALNIVTGSIYVVYILMKHIAG